MGNILRRGVQNYNVENRAHRVLDRKPKAAPKHPGSRDTQKDSKLPPIETLQKKDVNLLNMLQGINVDSSGYDPEFEKSKEIGSRLMPTDRQQKPEQTELWENIEHVPKGRLTVQQALELLAKHQRNRNEWPVERLAQEYSLNPIDTQNIVEYFQSFKVISMESKDSLPGNERKQLTT
ncbi:NADH dehydrogenase [ubiquinone] 1 alpha subcomplex assembly factor 4-like [Anneissia japonica]|uniref:NADH dehydrogenase [ubiquinone] 1 alpha subcomplex assembly factor 4-like n=1 Tax=Anneissia japonica TaxID=1529436 RepID=UPI0014258A64|nr:NADH dehydrogenase [ubiquinone] 1 alpha subcomplex assembly factor 4-like [Anneissia japonica]